MPAALQCPLERGLAPREGAGVELVLSIVVGADGVDARRGQRQQPADVGRRDEVPGRPEQVSAEDGAGVERPIDVRIGETAGAQASAHFAPVKSCDCTAPSQETTSAGVRKFVSRSR